MKEDNKILNLTFDFSIQIIGLYKLLVQQNEYVISKQLLRSATSIGANVEEATAAQTKKDFIMKMSIASKEARESKYWIELLIATDFLNSKDKHTQSMINDIEELIKLLTSIIKTTKANQMNGKFKMENGK